MSKTAEELIREAEKLYPMPEGWMQDHNRINDRAVVYALREGFVAGATRQADSGLTDEEKALHPVWTDHNGRKYKVFVQSDKTVYECIDNRLASYFVYHPLPPQSNKGQADTEGKGNL